MNWYKQNIGDYLKKTMHLTMLQDCSYRRMMEVYYATEKPLPLDRPLLYAKVRAHTVEERWAVDTVLTEFFKESKRGFTNKRCEEEIRNYHSMSKSAQANGLRGGRPKTNPVPVRLPSANRTESSQTTDYRLQTEEKPKTIHTPAKPGFRPPSQEEVCGYMKLRSIPNAEYQAERFIAHHDNRKWRLSGGRGPVMQDWRQAVITWEGNIGKFGGSNGTRQPSTTGVAAGVTRAEQRITEAQRQSERVLGRTSGLVGSLRADLPGRPDSGVACFLPGNSEALVIETRNPAPSVADRGAAVARVPAKTRTDLRDSGDADGAGEVESVLAISHRHTKVE